MIRIVINIILLAVVAVFVALNMPYHTGVNLFGWQVEEISTVSVVLVSLVVGVLYSFSLYLAAYFGRRKKARMKLKSSEVRSKEKGITRREKNLEEAEKVLEHEGSTATDDDDSTPQIKVGRIFSRRKNRRGNQS